MTLAETQRRMAAALMLPLTRADSIAHHAPTGLTMAKEAALFIKPNSRLTSAERLEIYSRSYWFRLLDSLRDDFPGLAAIVGPHAFERLARAYLADRPSRSFTLRDLGSELHAWLSEHLDEFAGANAEMALDMVRLEWAHIVAFDGPANTALGPEHLAELKPSLRVGLQPYLSLMELRYAVDDFRVRVNSEPEDSGVASNAPTGRKRRSARSLPLPVSEQVFVAIHRLDFSVYYRRLALEEFKLLLELRAGSSIYAAIEASFHGSSVPAETIPALLKSWFSAWAEFGWLTPHRRRRGGSHR
jgi:hypothetical protein